MMCSQIRGAGIEHDRLQNTHLELSETTIQIDHPCKNVMLWDSSRLMWVFSLCVTVVKATEHNLDILTTCAHCSLHRNCTCTLQTKLTKKLRLELRHHAHGMQPFILELFYKFFFNVYFFDPVSLLTWIAGATVWPNQQWAILSLEFLHLWKIARELEACTELNFCFQYCSDLLALILCWVIVWRCSKWYSKCPGELSVMSQIFYLLIWQSL